MGKYFSWSYDHLIRMSSINHFSFFFVWNFLWENSCKKEEIYWINTKSFSFALIFVLSSVLVRAICIELIRNLIKSVKQIRTNSIKFSFHYRRKNFTQNIFIQKTLSISLLLLIEIRARGHEFPNVQTKKKNFLPIVYGSWNAMTIIKIKRIK